MTLVDPVIHIVDDDEAIRHALTFQLQTAGYAVQDYVSAEAFLDAVPQGILGCVITDVRMPGITGLELVHRLKALGFCQPIIMMTGHGDIPLAVEAMKAGVIDFIEKPLDDELLLRAIVAALTAAATPEEEAAERRALNARFDSLSPRERDVLVGVVAGKANKIIAYDLGISPRTVEVYRAGLMSKTGAASLSALVRMALALGL
jgi:two-component system response regulator FixJ